MSNDNSVIDPKQAYEIILKYTKGQEKILNLKNFRKVTRFQGQKPVNMYKFTVDLLLIELIFDLNSDENVETVMWNASMPPPGAGIDGVSMRYKVYIQFKK